MVCPLCKANKKYDSRTLRLPKIVKENGKKVFEGTKGYDPGGEKGCCSYKLTPAMIQWWEFKEMYFDCILMFKVGKFYEIFYSDAIICQQLLDLNWMGGAKKLHIGFPEKALDKYLP